MEDNSKARYELKKQMRYLRGVSGSGTELISVYIPPKHPVHEISSKLKGEAGQAANIKSKSTRKNVTDALERIIHHLKSYREPPDNGMAIFAGNVSDNPAKVDIAIYTVVPPEPIQVQLYRCDSKFFLEPLDKMVEIKDAYGLIVMDGREATLAMLKGTNVQILKKLNSMAHAKIRKGGQSARRFERLIEESIEKYYKRIGESMDRYFVMGTKGVIVGGPGPAKDDFVKMKPFNYQIKLLGVVDTGYVDEYGVRELMAKSGDILAEQHAIVEKKLVDRFIRDVVSGGLAAYGEMEVRAALESRKAESLLISEEVAYKRVALKCANCGAEKSLSVREVSNAGDKKCECGGNMKVVSEKPLTDDLIELANDNNIPIHVISTNTVEGNQFLASFYGMGAFLRYK